LAEAQQGIDLSITGTPVLEKNLQATSRIIVNQGGTRSSKTYSIAQKYIIRLLQETGKVLTIMRKTSPSLRASVLRDFFCILNELGLYSDENYNKSTGEYFINGNLVEFISLDQPQKKRGTKRNYAWLNEANEFTYEDFFQIEIRTTEEITLDYNPSDEFSWIYEKVIPRSDCTFIQSTYKDNPFLEESLVNEIERLQTIDENYWKIYGLGERGQSQTTIYPNWEMIDVFPTNVDEIVYGVDFGYNNPSVVVKVGVKDGKSIYVHEELYESHLTNQDLINKLKSIVTNRNKIMKCDCEDPARIEELCRAGFNARACMKGKNSVKDGIDNVKMLKVYVTKSSINIEKERRNYKWKTDKDGHVLDEPVKFSDHAMDAIRYAIGDFKECEVRAWDL
jgi:phage terminase large subunit